MAIGRPRKNPPADAEARIKELAAKGFSILGIAQDLGTGKDVLARWFDEQPALKQALEAGRETERHTLHNVLYRLATEGNDKIAAMFLLKARHGYREGDQEQQANRVSINFQLPGAMKREQITIENESTKPQ